MPPSRFAPLGGSAPHGAADRGWMRDARGRASAGMCGTWPWGVPPGLPRGDWVKNSEKLRTGGALAVRSAAHLVSEMTAGTTTHNGSMGPSHTPKDPRLYRAACTTRHSPGANLIEAGALAHPALSDKYGLPQRTRDTTARYPYPQHAVPMRNPCVPASPPSPTRGWPLCRSCLQQDWLRGQMAADLLGELVVHETGKRARHEIRSEIEHALHDLCHRGRCGESERVLWRRGGGLR